MGDEHQHAGKVLLRKLAPEALVEPADAVIGVRRALAVRDAVEKVAVSRALVPHALHLLGAWLKVAKVLLTDARLLVDLCFIGVRVVGEGGEDALCRLASAGIGRGDDLEGIGRTEELEEAFAGFGGLREVSLRRQALLRDDIPDDAPPS
jgi:hypothetical protein